MPGVTVVLGFGAVGRATARTLLARGDAVRVAQRSRPADLPDQAEFRACDVLDARSVCAAIDGASQVVLAVGFPYDSRIWRTAWPQTIANVVEACAATHARIVFVDNLYMLGPQRKPRREDMPLTARGEKPAILSNVTRIWMAAAKAGTRPHRITALHGFLRAWRPSLPFGRNSLRRARARPLRAATCTARYATRLRLRARYRPRRDRALGRPRRRLRPSLEHAVHTDADAARDSAIGRRRARRQRPSLYGSCRCWASSRASCARSGMCALPGIAPTSSTRQNSNAASASK